MGQRTSAGARATMSWAGLACTALAAVQFLAWARLTASPLGTPGALAAGLPAALAIALGLGACWGRSWVTRAGRVLPAATVLAGGLLGWGAAPFLLLGLPPGGASGVLGGLLASTLVIGPAGFLCGARLGADAVLPSWLGWAAVTGALALGPEALAPVVGLLAPAGLWLLLPPPPAGRAGREGGVARPAAWPLAAAAAFAAVAVASWSRFLSLIVLGTSLPPALGPLLPVTLGGAVGAVAALGGRGHWRQPPPWRNGTALLTGALVALLALLAAPRLVGLFLTLSLAGWGTGAALLPGFLVLAPLTALVVLGLGGHGSDRPARPALALPLGAAAGIVSEALVLAPLLGPDRLVVFSVPALALGAALPVLLLEVPSASRRWRLGATGVAAASSLAALLAGMPDTRLSGAGIPWRPGAFIMDGRPALADRLGRLLVLQDWSGAAGYLVRRQASGQPAETAWQGWPLTAADPVRRACAAAGGALSALLHPGPQRGLLLGDDGGGRAAGLQAAAPAMKLVRTARVPGLHNFLSGSDDLLPVAAAVPASGSARYDVLVLHPLSPQASGSGLAWSAEALARAKAALNPGGIMALVVSPESLPPGAFRRIVSTFTGVFPATSLWFDGGDLVLVGSAVTATADLSAFEKRFREARPVLLECGLQRAVDLLGRLVLPDAGLRALAEEMPRETVRRPRLGGDMSATRGPARRSGSREDLLGRLIVVPDAALGLFPGLAPGAAESLRQSLLPVAQATQHLLLARAMAATDLQSAVEHAQEGMRLHPENRLLRRHLAALAVEAASGALAAGLLEDAIAWAQRSVDLDPGQVAHHLRLYSLLEQAGRGVATQRRLADMAVRFPDAYPVLLAQAWRRLEQADVDTADAFLQRAAATGYETFELAVGQARVAYARQQEALGDKHLARALALGPDDGLVLASMGAGLLAQDPERAAVLLHRARDLGRDAADVNGPLGRLALQRGDAAGAIPLLEEAVRQAPQVSMEQARLRLDLGSSLLLTGRAAEAIPHLEAAARLAPGEPLIRLNLGAALSRVGRREEARRQLERIGDRLPGNPILERLRQDLGMPPAVSGKGT